MSAKQSKNQHMFETNGRNHFASVGSNRNTKLYLVVSRCRRFLRKKFYFPYLSIKHDSETFPN